MRLVLKLIFQFFQEIGGMIIFKEEDPNVPVFTWGLEQFVSILSIINSLGILSSISVFGIGSLIHTGIEIGDNFEAGFYAGRGSCLDIETALRSSLQMVWNVS